MFLDRAQAAFEIKRWDLAKSECEKHLAQEPDDSVALVMLAACQLNLGQNKLASDNAKEALRQNGQCPDAFYVLALASRNEHRPKECERFYKQALALEPNDPRYLCGLAQLHFDLAPGAVIPDHRYKKGLQLLDQALAIEPERCETLQLKAYGLTKLGRFTEADSLRSLALAVSWESRS